MVDGNGPQGVAGVTNGQFSLTVLRACNWEFDVLAGVSVTSSVDAEHFVLFDRGDCWAIRATEESIEHFVRSVMPALYKVVLIRRRRYVDAEAERWLGLEAGLENMVLVMDDMPTIDLPMPDPNVHELVTRFEREAHAELEAFRAQFGGVLIST